MFGGTQMIPFFFSLLWNIVITPLPISFILDKQEENMYVTIENAKNKKFIKEFKDIIKAIAIQLYQPNELMQEKLVDLPNEDIMKRADDLIKRDKIKFLPFHTTYLN